AIHRRCVSFAVPNRFVVEDHLIGGKPTAAEVGLLVAPELTLREMPTGWRIDNDQDPLLTIECMSTAGRRVERGELEPIRGWFSPRFGEKEPASRLVIRFPSDGSPLVTKLIVHA